ncbi:uncharacterized protein LOC143453039 [Clavelina lepadiformis]|uniref:uncharacterized protein LOC143453039 n=1 Tax=Clavelina lepadiformis TaxID=159417 RepID=UPI0040437503
MKMRNVDEQENVFENNTVDPQIPRRPHNKKGNKWIIAATLVGVFTIASVVLATVGYTQVQQLHDETSRLRESLANSQRQQSEAIGFVSEGLANSQRQQTEAIRNLSGCSCSIR